MAAFELGFHGDQGLEQGLDDPALDRRIGPRQGIVRIPRRERPPSSEHLADGDIAARPPFGSLHGRTGRGFHFISVRFARRSLCLGASTQRDPSPEGGPLRPGAGLSRAAIAGKRLAARGAPALVGSRREFGIGRGSGGIGRSKGGRGESGRMGGRRDSIPTLRSFLVVVRARVGIRRVAKGHRILTEPRGR
ncbi:MAG: hypothetical protein R3F21_18365 [Myxococcota bacterium]